MPKLLTQLWESWLSVFWEMSGLQETEVPAHTIQQVGGEKREQGVVSAVNKYSKQEDRKEKTFDYFREGG